MRKKHGYKYIDSVTGGEGIVDKANGRIDMITDRDENRIVDRNTIRIRIGMGRHIPSRKRLRIREGTIVDRTRDIMHHHCE